MPGSMRDLINLMETEMSDNLPPYKCPEDVDRYFRGRVLFPATERLVAHLEEQRKRRCYRVFLYVLPDGQYDIFRQNRDHSLMEPYAVAEYSCGCWEIITRSALPSGGDVSRHVPNVTDDEGDENDW